MKHPHENFLRKPLSIWCQ